MVFPAGEQADSIVCFPWEHCLVEHGRSSRVFPSIGSSVLTGSDQTLTKAAKLFLGQKTQSVFIIKKKSIYYKPACEPEY